MPDNDMPRGSSTRRTVLRAGAHAAWVVPAVTLATAAPAFASASNPATLSQVFQATNPTSGTAPTSNLTWTLSDAGGDNLGAVTIHLTGQFTTLSNVVGATAVRNANGDYTLTLTPPTIAANGGVAQVTATAALVPGGGTTTGGVEVWSLSSVASGSDVLTAQTLIDTEMASPSYPPPAQLSATLSGTNPTTLTAPTSSMTMTITNIGGSTASAISAQLSGQISSISGVSGGTASGLTITLPGTLAAGASVTVTFTATLPNPGTGTSTGETWKVTTTVAGTDQPTSAALSASASATLTEALTTSLTVVGTLNSPAVDTALSTSNAGASNAAGTTSGSTTAGYWQSTGNSAWTVTNTGTEPITAPTVTFGGDVLALSTSTGAVAGTTVTLTGVTLQPGDSTTFIPTLTLKSGTISPLTSNSSATGVTSTWTVNVSGAGKGTITTNTATATGTGTGAKTLTQNAANVVFSGAARTNLGLTHTLTAINAGPEPALIKFTPGSLGSLLNLTAAWSNVPATNTSGLSLLASGVSVVIAPNSTGKLTFTTLSVLSISWTMTYSDHNTGMTSQSKSD